MPIRTRTFRVFVSSTFTDLKAERNELQRDVFPRLRKLCEEHGARFQAIDLRWGVRDEAALDQKTMEICLRETERCQRTGIKPNFIVLLGQRYGWRPVPARIEVREFDAVRARFPGLGERALIDHWFQRDDNAVPPEYLLRPREGRWVDQARWQAIEACLHLILLHAARAAGLSEESLLKYEASATHQEILKGLAGTPADRRHVFAFCRDVPDRNCDPELLNLKNFLRAHLPAGNVHSYAPGDLAGLCHDVEQTLRAVIEGEATGFESVPALALEIVAHDAFARERALVFGREKVLDAIAEYIRAGGDRPLVLHGISGSGKSAVMARASECVPAALPSAVVVRRFIGASPESSSGPTLLGSLSAQIAEAYGVKEELPADFTGLARRFRERLGLATSESPLVVFLDAVDQLGTNDPARPLDWLGGALPAHCRIVVSATSVAPALSGCLLLPLEDLSLRASARALRYWLAEGHRTLQRAQRKRLLSAFSRCRLPLYLKLAFNEARNWTSFQSVDRSLLGDGVEGVIDTLIERLSLEANHGPVLARRSLGYLAAARYGLTEDEILDVLSADPEVWRDFEEKRNKDHDLLEPGLPVIIWSRLFLDLEPYLAERSAPGGTVVSFYHPQLAGQVATRFLDGEQHRHQALAGYFAKQPLLFQGTEIARYNRRKLYELPYQQAKAAMWTEAARTLTNLEFVAAKAAGELGQDLLRDFERCTDPAAAQAVSPVRRVLPIVLAAMEERPEYALSVLYNYLRASSPGSEALETATDGLRRRGVWLKADSPLPEAGAAVQGDLSFGRSCSIQAAARAAGMLALSQEDEIDVVDCRSGLRIARYPVSGPVTALACSPDGKRLAWVDASGKLCTPERSAPCVALVPEDDERVLALLADGTALALSHDRSLVWWDPDRDTTEVIATAIATPVRTLRADVRSEAVLLLAGEPARRLIVLRRQHGAWTTSALSSRVPMVDCDFDSQEALLAVVTIDRRVSVYRMRSGDAEPFAELYYERSPDLLVRGPVVRCVLGSGQTENEVVFATEGGQICAWNWATGQLADRGAWRLPRQPRNLVCLETLVPEGRVLVSTEERAFLMAPERERRDSAEPARCVCLTRGGSIVAGRTESNLVSWHSIDGRIKHSAPFRAPTVLAADYHSDSVWAGGRFGDVRLLTREGLSPGAPWSVFGRVEGLAARPGPCEVIVAGADGNVLRLPRDEQERSGVTYLWNGTERDSIVKAIDALPVGLLWVLERVRESLGTYDRIALLSGPQDRRVVFSGPRIDDFAVSPSGEWLAIAAAGRVQVIRPLVEGAGPPWERGTPARLVAFCCGGSRLAVVGEGHWLDIWQVKPGLPAVEAFYLRSRPLCLAAEGNRIALACDTGEIFSVAVEEAN